LTRRFSDIRLQNAFTLKTGLRLRQGHWKCHALRLPIDVVVG